VTGQKTGASALGLQRLSSGHFAATSVKGIAHIGNI
jgi:hypothetical protein